MCKGKRDLRTHQRFCNQNSTPEPDDNGDISNNQNIEPTEERDTRESVYNNDKYKPGMKFPPTKMTGTRPTNICIPLSTSIVSTNRPIWIKLSSSLKKRNYLKSKLHEFPVHLQTNTIRSLVLIVYIIL